MSERAQRIAANEALFRDVNENIESLSRSLLDATETIEIVCECGDGECVERLTIPMRDYEAMRSSPLLFALVPGHERPEVEEVVDDRGGYFVVRKSAGEGQRIAEATNPRG